MSETRKLAAILAADVVGYSRLACADEEGTLARLRALRSELIDPAVASHRGRVVKRTGDGALVEFRSVVDAVRCAVELQDGMRERNDGLPHERQIEFRIGVHLGDVVEEPDGDLMGDGVNIAARLERIAEPAGICLSEDAYRQVREKLKHPFVDLGEKDLKNIALPMRVYAVKRGLEGAKRAPASSTLASTGQEPPRLSIVVLPFVNMSGDPEQDYFVDGVTESLTTDLSRIDGSIVIGRSTAFTYKGKNVDLRRLGRELNVRYVLEGSVQRSGGRMRVGVQLIDAESGSHLWAERFDKPVDDLFDMQDEIVGRLANALYAQLTAAEARRAERAPNPDSMDVWFQGRACLTKGFTADILARARHFFERALTLDPANVRALVELAVVDLASALMLFPDDRAQRLAAAEAAVNRALSLTPNFPSAHLILGTVKTWTNRPLEGIRECERALELNRNQAEAHAQIGAAKILLGRAEETEAHIQQALRLSPHDTFAFVWYTIAGGAKLHVGKEEEAVAWLRRSIEGSRNYSTSRFLLAAALAHLGRLAEARSVAEAGLAIVPTFTIARFRAVASASSDNPLCLAGWERIIEGLRKAGVPEE
jgi:TolB-like protein/class 3 adenylate cyclase